MYVPSIGVTYTFHFIPEFTHWNATYFVSKIMTYQEALNEQVRFLEAWYVPAGQDQAKLDADLLQLEQSRILKLLDPDIKDDSAPVVFAPLMYIDRLPNPDVKKYWSLGLGLHLGYVKDPELLESAVAILQEHLIAALGVTDVPKLFEIKSKYMTDEEYAEYDAQRDLASKSVISYFTQVQDLSRRLDHVRTIAQYYEEKLIALGIRDSV